MHTFPVPRKQGDGKQRAYSEAAAIDTGTEDLARQEFRDETDINTILKRFGVTGLPARVPVFGEQDFDMDLQNALHAIDEAQDAWERAHPKVKERYPTWQQLLNAAQAGRLDLSTSDPAPEVPATKSDT